MTAVSIIPPYFRAWDQTTGAPLAGGKVYTYDTGTSTLKTSWQDEGKAATNTNPVILDAAGKAKIHLDGVYRIVVHDSNDVLVWEADPVSSVSSDAELAAVNTALGDRATSLETLTSTRFPYVLADNEDPQTLDLSTYYSISTQTGLFYYDASDTTTAHDGVTVIVDSTGRRFKRALAEVNSFKAWQTAPPGSPQSGEAYLVKSVATGAWAGHEDDIAVYTARGLLFLSPRISARYDEAWGGHLLYDGSAWQRGIGKLPFSKYALGIVVQEELDTPAVAPTDGQMWLVGTAPTGAWAGKAANIAEWIDAHQEWEFLAPFEGAVIYDLDVTAGTAVGERRYTSGAWQAPASAPSIPNTSGYTFEGTFQTLSSSIPVSGSDTLTIPTGEWAIIDGFAEVVSVTGGTASLEVTVSGANLARDPTGAVSSNDARIAIYGRASGGDTVTIIAGNATGGETTNARGRLVLAKLTAVS
ncbi:MAG: DUF2793 domain-containing protein [Alphaproteobacteria bacterium]|nr:MAG: DUF2793 domain-containing protein [Alphaproteobacteria bacterium]